MKGSFSVPVGVEGFHGSGMAQRRVSLSGVGRSCGTWTIPIHGVRIAFSSRRMRRRGQSVSGSVSSASDASRHRAPTLERAVTMPGRCELCEFAWQLGKRHCRFPLRKCCGSSLSARRIECRTVRPTANAPSSARWSPNVSCPERGRASRARAAAASGRFSRMRSDRFAAHRAPLSDTIERRRSMAWPVHKWARHRVRAERACARARWCVCG